MERSDGEIPAKSPKLSDGGDGRSGEDRLSAVPDDLLIHILLKLRDAPAAARTSVLSRRWRRIWTLLPELHFPAHSDPHRIRLALAAHEAPVLRLLDVAILDATPEQSTSLERGAFELPCFENATSIGLALDHLGLAVPSSGVFARLTTLFLNAVRLDGPCSLGDAVSWPRCPSLRSLFVHNAWGVRNLAIHSDSLRGMELYNLQSDNPLGLGNLTIRSDSLLLMRLLSVHGLKQLTVMASALEVLIVKACISRALSNNYKPAVNISTPQLTFLEWADHYDPNYIQLGMENLERLGTIHFLVYGYLEAKIHNSDCTRLLRRFEAIQTLRLTLLYLPEITNREYLMESITKLPNIAFMVLEIMANGHSFGASSFHVLRMCIGIRKLSLKLLDTPSQMLGQTLQAQTSCPSGCACDQPPNWKTEDLKLYCLREVEIRNLRGTEHEAALLKRLFHWATVLEKMTVTFHCRITEIKAKEFCQILQSFSRPEISISMSVEVALLTLGETSGV